MLHKHKTETYFLLVQRPTNMFLSEVTLALGIAMFVSNKLLSFYLSFCIQIERSGTFQNNQRLRVFALFNFSTTWLNSTVKGSATDE